MGGVGREQLYDLAMTSNGPMVMGYSDSASFTMGDIEIHNLQHDFMGKEETELAGRYGMFAVVLSPTDATPSCITACPSGVFTDATTTIAAAAAVAAHAGAAVPGHHVERARPDHVVGPVAVEAPIARVDDVPGGPRRRVVGAADQVGALVDVRVAAEHDVHAEVRVAWLAAKRCWFVCGVCCPFRCHEGVAAMASVAPRPP